MEDRNNLEFKIHILNKKKGELYHSDGLLNRSYSIQKCQAIEKEIDNIEQELKLINESLTACSWACINVFDRIQQESVPEKPVEIHAQYIRKRANANTEKLREKLGKIESLLAAFNELD